MLCCQFTVRYKEHLPNAEWFEVEPGACVPFWPSKAGLTKQLVASIKGTDLETKPFDITDSHITLLKLYHDVSTISLVLIGEGQEVLCVNCFEVNAEEFNIFRYL